MPRPKKQDRFDWILNWLHTNFSADVANRLFHDDYHEKFSTYKVHETNWGASPVYQAMYDLAEMEKAGILERERVSLTDHEPGFPNWVYVYTLPAVRRAR